MFAEIAFLLYLAHLVADYPLQSDHQAAHKSAPGWPGWWANLTHAAAHGTTCGLALVVGISVLEWHISGPAAVGALVWIAATHALIDRRWPVAWWMRVAGQQRWARNGGAAHIDQTAHITALTIAALALA
ncbi:DUF3307 domain-containing protein [Streptomyces alkaliphilus]|uniref:DUF3307 domain-containing protein n=1 Tax=Streptomyces alkaliphilus TaxID=1472722 RepID=A0A7W3TEA0_9ACTN|nr:DUF3307 domain-containing protein [Streptomyces alkaliphilus]MBB0245212.1 DUF3307 domain-containing protein [Streptomyces alkaliphilus]